MKPSKGLTCGPRVRGLFQKESKQMDATPLYCFFKVSVGFASFFFSSGSFDLFTVSYPFRSRFVPVPFRCRPVPLRPVPFCPVPVSFRSLPFPFRSRFVPVSFPSHSVPFWTARLKRKNWQAKFPRSYLTCWRGLTTVSESTGGPVSYSPAESNLLRGDPLYESLNDLDRPPTPNLVC